MIKQSFLLAILAILTQFNPLKACCYNTDCYVSYSGANACFVKSTFGSSYANEGFCWDGDCTPVFGNGGGTCRKKRSVGQSCQNAGGNYDNNYCVTKFCNHASGVCEIRTSGCASFVDCAGDVLANIADSLQTFTDILGGIEEITASECENNGTVCYGNVSLTPPANEVALAYSNTKFEDILTIGGSVNMKFPKKFHVDFSFKKNFFIVFGVKDIDLNFNDVEFTLDLRQAYAEIDENLVLSDGQGICKNPLDTEGRCAPHILYEKSVKIGKLSVQIQVGAQLVGRITGSITANSNFKVSFKINEEITIPFIGFEITEDDISLEGLSEAFNEIKAASDIEFDLAKFNEDISITSDVQLRIAPQVYLAVNGIAIQGGVDIVFDAIAQIQGGTTSNDCVSGSAAFAVGMLLGFYSPPFSIKTGTTAICKTIVGDAQDVEGADNIETDNYGTQCEMLTNVCKSKFDLCDEIGDIAQSAMNFITGKKVQTDEFYTCDRLFQASDKATVKINGYELCDSNITATVKCDGSQAYTDSIYDSCDGYFTSAFNFFTIFILLFSLFVI